MEDGAKAKTNRAGAANAEGGEKIGENAVESADEAALRRDQRRADGGETVERPKAGGGKGRAATGQRRRGAAMRNGEVEVVGAEERAGAGCRPHSRLRTRGLPFKILPIPKAFPFRRCETSPFTLRFPKEAVSTRRRLPRPTGGVVVPRENHLSRMEMEDRVGMRDWDGYLQAWGNRM